MLLGSFDLLQVSLVRLAAVRDVPFARVHPLEDAVTPRAPVVKAREVLYGGVPPDVLVEVVRTVIWLKE